eukprot:TRINITY_DN26750_c0_g1_i1.p1 TRINITY_DN26750_c0_g1~~TRINITY_DN26750_c0_g1_i1.p1  ORF type:complete len:308 (+),score=86.42 TRINITY_DN26750_c0_g1_i1:42-926(+)
MVRFVKSGTAGIASFKNEDRCFVVEEDDWAVYGVLDGHGGRAAVMQCVHLMPGMVLETLRGCDESALHTSPEDFREELSGRLERVYRTLDDHIISTVHDFSGACVTIMMLRKQVPYCFVAHLGDCRVVLMRDGAAVALTEDHQLSNPAECERVARTGYRTEYGRVAGLEPTRTLGDGDVKAEAPDAISCIPEVLMHCLQPAAPCGGGVARKSSKRQAGGKVASKPGPASPLMLLLATDGVWGTVRNSAACSTADRAMRGKAGLNARAAASAVTSLALAKGSDDDITAIAVYAEV